MCQGGRPCVFLHTCSVGPRVGLMRLPGVAAAAPRPVAFPSVDLRVLLSLSIRHVNWGKGGGGCVAGGRNAPNSVNTGLQAWSKVPVLPKAFGCSRSIREDVLLCFQSKTSRFFLADPGTSSLMV